MADTHTVMSKKLAQALMESSMQHFGSGGLVGGILPALGADNEFHAESGGFTQGQIEHQYNQEQDVYGQQQALASQLLAQTQGQGPGQQLIAQQAGQNAAQQGALMASARGASSNPALVARQAALAGQAGQQQALNSQAALQLQSQGALAQQQAQMGNQALQGQSIAQGALASQNQVNAGVAGQNSQQNSGLLGGIVGGIAGAFGLAKGGQVPKMAVGGPVQMMGMQNYAGAPQMPGGAGNMADSMDLGHTAGAGLNKWLKKPGSDPNALAGGPMDMMDNNPMLSPGAELGGVMPMMAMASQGGSIPFRQMLAGGNVGGKAKVSGDSEKNDTVPTMLSPGEVVIPRSIAQSADAPEKAAEFLRHLKSKKGYAGVQAARSKNGNS